MPKKKANRTKPHPKAKATTRAAPLEVESISAGDGETRPSAGDELTVHVRRCCCWRRRLLLLLLVPCQA